MVQVYVVDLEAKEISLQPISEDDPLIKHVQTYIVRIPHKILWWTREKVFPISVVFSRIPSVALDEQKLFTERLARRLATTAISNSNTFLPTIIGFLTGAVTVFIGGKFL